MDTETPTANNLAGLFKSQPALRQVVLLIGLAASIAAGIAGAMWLRQPEFSVLASGVSAGEASEIVQSLSAAGFEYDVDESTGAVRVKPSQLYDARMALASAGLPRGAGTGFEMLQEESGITSSQFMENARYHNMIETELSRTISSLRPVQSARVHLALPRTTVFLRDKESPSASVLVHLFPGRVLEAPQVSAIVNLVASSIPELESSRVTVLDQSGSELTETGGTDELVQSERQLEYVRRLEQGYVDRILGLLSPLVGPNSLRATVAADLDFTVQEESSELYDPDGVVVRSEQLQENRNSPGATNAGGIPGALSNQPPLQPAEVAAGAVVAAVDSTLPVNETLRSTRNYELNKTLSVTRRPSGTVDRLAVAVIVDEEALLANAEEGADSSAMLARVEQLARQAVGFNEVRGDTITVTSGSFYQAPPPPEVEEPSFFTTPGFRNIVMQVLSVVVLLVVGWGVVRPIVRMLTAPAGESFMPGQPMLAAASGNAAVPAARPIAQLNYGDKVAAAKQLVGHDSERVAEIVKGWVKTDG